MINSYTRNTNHRIKHGEDTLRDSEKKLKDFFVPGSYQHFYDYTFYDKSFMLPEYSSILQNLAVSQEMFRQKILALLKPDPDDVNDTDSSSQASAQKLETHISEIKFYRALEISLYALESKIIEHPTSVFVDTLIQQGTALDLLGYIEKLRYDKIYRDLDMMGYAADCLHYCKKVSDLRYDRVTSYIDKIICAFDERYGQDAYLEVETFKKKYLEHHPRKGTPRSCDEVFTKAKYVCFMKALETALGTKFALKKIA